MTSIVLTLLINNSPAPTSVHDALQEITVDTRIDAAGSFRLRLGLAPGDDGNWPLLDQSLFPPGASVRIGVAVDRPNPAFLLVGYVAAQSVVFGDGQVAPSVEISGVDATALMNLEEKTVAWPNMADSVIATKILGAHQLAPQVTTTSPVLSDPEGTTVQRGTDIRFLRRLARRNGFEVYVLPQPDSGVESGYFGPLSTSGAPATTLAVHAGDSTSVTDVKIANDMLRPTEVVADGVDARHTTQNSDVSTASKTVGRTSTVGQLSPQPKLRLTGTGLTSATDLQRAAQAAVDRSSYSLVATGQVPATIGPLVPGTVVSLAGAGDAYSGPWVLRRVKHVIAPGVYTQHFTATRNGVGNTGPAAGAGT